jgi:hypothetical protein
LLTLQRARKSIPEEISSASRFVIDEDFSVKAEAQFLPFEDPIKSNR